MIYIIIILMIIAADRLSKQYIEKNFKISEQKKLIKNTLYLKLLKNKGAAYGIFASKANKLLIFNLIGLTAVVITFIYFIIKVKGEKMIKIILSFIIGGAIGNISDRIKNGSVTDFIYIKFKKAPVFNIADLFLFASFILSLIRIIINKK